MLCLPSLLFQLISPSPSSHCPNGGISWSVSSPHPHPVISSSNSLGLIHPFFVLWVYSQDITWQISIVQLQALLVISLLKGNIQRLAPHKLQGLISVSVQPSLTANRAPSEPPTLPGPSTSHPWHLVLSHVGSIYAPICFSSRRKLVFVSSLGFWVRRDD